MLCASQVHEAVLRITSNPLSCDVHMVCTYGMYWCLMVFDGGLLAGCDVQEWIGSLARRGICLLHLVDEEVRIFVWLCQSVTCKAKA